MPGTWHDRTKMIVIFSFNKNILGKEGKNVKTCSFQQNKAACLLQETLVLYTYFSSWNQVLMHHLSYTKLHWSLSQVRWIHLVDIFTSCFLRIHFSIILQSRLRSPRKSHSFKISNQISAHMPYPVRHHWFDCLNLYCPHVPYVVQALNPRVMCVPYIVRCGHLNAPYTHV